MNMFCGLPIKVAADPTFDAQASPSRNGIGVSCRRAQTSMSIGAMARHTMSLASTADSAPAARITDDRSCPR
jgi:hypothetical protein